MSQVPAPPAPPAEALKRDLLVLNAERQQRGQKPLSCAALATAINILDGRPALHLTKSTVSRLLNGKLQSPYGVSYRVRLAEVLQAERASLVPPSELGGSEPCTLKPEPAPPQRRKRYTSDAHLEREVRVSKEGYFEYGRHTYYGGAVFAGMKCKVRAARPKGTVKITDGLATTRHLSPIDATENDLGYKSPRNKQQAQCRSCGAPLQ